MVQHIKGIRAELQIYLVFIDRESLAKAQIQVEVLWSAQVIALTDVEANRTRKRVQRSCRIAEAIHCSAGAFVDVRLQQRRLPDKNRRSIVGVSGHKRIRRRKVSIAAM